MKKLLGPNVGKNKIQILISNQNCKKPSQLGTLIHKTIIFRFFFQKTTTIVLTVFTLNKQLELFE